MNRYHYIDEQGNISDALPLAALHRIGLAPATKVLLEGTKQWITLAEASGSGPTILPVTPLHQNVTPPPIAAVAHSDQSFLKILLVAMFFGVLGLHRFMVGKWKTGVLQLITFGGLGFWVFVDVVMILLGKFTDGKYLAIPNPNPKATWAVFGTVIVLGMVSNSNHKKTATESTIDEHRASAAANVKKKDVAGTWVNGDSKVILGFGGSYMSENPLKSFFGKWEKVGDSTIKITFSDGSVEYSTYDAGSDRLKHSGVTFRRE